MRWPGRSEVRCQCGDDGHHLQSGRVVLRTATPADIPALLKIVDKDVIAANRWRADEEWIARHLGSQTGRRHNGHDFVEHLIVEVKDRPAGMRSMYKRGDRLVTNGWMRASNWRDHDAELDAVTRFTHFHLGFPVVFSMAAQDDTSDRELLADHGWTGPHRADRGIEQTTNDVAALDVYIHRERDARHTCTTLAGPTGLAGSGAPTSRPTTVQPSTGGESSMGFKVVVDFDKCESNALCMGVAPEVFEVRDDDFLYILQEEPPEESRERCNEAARLCPKQAITIVDL